MWVRKEKVVPKRKDIENSKNLYLCVFAAYQNKLTIPMVGDFF